MRPRWAFLLSFSLLTMEQVPAFSVISPPLWPDSGEIEHFLREAEIVERHEIGEGVTKPEKVTLEMDGVVRNAVFKKVDMEFDNWRYEIAAYELDKLLGMGMVPPTVERRVGGRKGCLQLWVEGETLHQSERTPPDLDRWHEQVSVMWLFDDLIANIDRHLNNAIMSPDNRLILIDNSKTFRSFRNLLNHLNGPGTGTHARFWCVPYDAKREGYAIRYPEGFIERFRQLSNDQIKDAIGKYVWGYNKDLVVKRRALILDRIDELTPKAVKVN